MVALRYILLGSALVSTMASSGQGRTIVAGLETHTEYRALVADEAALAHTADSLSKQLDGARLAFRLDTVGRGAVAAAILRMEEASFEVRGRMARLATRINAIEQKWILENLHADGGDEGHIDMEQGGEGAATGGGKAAETLSWREFFERNLTHDQLAEFRSTEASEAATTRSMERLRENAALAAALAAHYERVATRAGADSIRARFEVLEARNRALDSVAAREWETIYDSKSYIYTLVAEKWGPKKLSQEWQRALLSVGGELSAARERSWSRAMADYTVQKPLLLAHEARLARAIGDASMADSLNHAAKTFSARGLGAPDLPEPIALPERLWLDYADISTGVWPYNQHNPIPQVEIPPRGVMWRVLVGTFRTQQGPAMFHGVAPIAMQKENDGRWSYFAGGFPTENEALAAVELLRRAGFRNPVPVVWVDGMPVDSDSAAKPAKIEEQ